MIRQLNNPEAYIVWTEKDGWLNLGGEQWIKNDPSYVKFSKKSTVDSSIVGKRVVSKVNNLRFYDALSWRDKDVAGFVEEIYINYRWKSDRVWPQRNETAFYY